MPIMESPNDAPPPKAPITISIIGTGTGDGGGVAPTPNGTLATTPGHQPNLIVQVIGPIVAVLVRAVVLFLTTFSAALSVAGIGGDKILPVNDLHHAVMLAVYLGGTAAGLGTIKNLITIFGRLEGKFPLLTGSI